MLVPVPLRSKSSVCPSVYEFMMPTQTRNMQKAVSVNICSEDLLSPTKVLYGDDWTLKCPYLSHELQEKDLFDDVLSKNLITAHNFKNSSFVTSHLTSLFYTLPKVYLAHTDF